MKAKITSLKLHGIEKPKKFYEEILGHAIELSSIENGVWIRSLAKQSPLDRYSVDDIDTIYSPKFTFTRNAIQIYGFVDMASGGKNFHQISIEVQPIN